MPGIFTSPAKTQNKARRSHEQGWNKINYLPFCNSTSIDCIHIISYQLNAPNPSSKIWPHIFFFGGGGGRYSNILRTSLLLPPMFLMSTSNSEGFHLKRQHVGLASLRTGMVGVASCSSLFLVKPESSISPCPPPRANRDSISWLPRKPDTLEQKPTDVFFGRMKALSKQFKTHVKCVCAWANTRTGHLYDTPIFFNGSALNFLSPRVNTLSAKYTLQIKSSGLIHFKSRICQAQQLPHFPGGLHSTVHTWFTGPAISRWICLALFKPGKTGQEKGVPTQESPCPLLVYLVFSTFT